MKKIYFLAASLGAVMLLVACQTVQAQNQSIAKAVKNQTIIYFNPTVYPDIEEIKDPTYSSFFSAVSDRVDRERKHKMLRVETDMAFDSVDSGYLKEYCANNNAAFAIVPKVKYFKVGFGKYVFSNQVVISLKLYNADGVLVGESDYDTYKKKARMLGSAENSIKIGTEGALKLMGKKLKQSKNSSVPFSDN